MAQVKIVIGGQYGSEGKGAFIAWLTDPKRCSWPMVIRTGGPQAGHSMKYNGQTYAMRMIPCAWHNPQAVLCLGPGALIDLDVFEAELDFISVALGLNYRERHHLNIDPNAVIVEPSHHADEADLGLAERTGSTGEGVGAATGDRALRLARLAKDEPRLLPFLADVPDLVYGWSKTQGPIIVESTQGFMLSNTRSGMYPHVTSRDITPAQALNDAGIPSQWPHDVYMVMRTYPIRIAGPSGPMPAEVSWDDLAARTNGYVRPEITTVTKKTRRVSEWSDAEALFAIRNCQPSAICLTFLDYWFPRLNGCNVVTGSDVIARLMNLEATLGVPIRWVSTGFQEIHEIVK